MLHAEMNQCILLSEVKSVFHFFYNMQLLTDWSHLNFACFFVVSVHICSFFTKVPYEELDYRAKMDVGFTTTAATVQW